MREAGLELRRRLGVPADHLLIGTVGRLFPDKNQLALLQGLGTLREKGIPAHLLMIGDGPHRPLLESAANDLGLREVTCFAGAASDVRAGLAAMDIFALPSVEVFSNAALEAMAMSLPVIVTKQGGGPEMVTDGDDGMLADADHFAAEFPAAAAALWHDASRRKSMGDNARTTVVQRFTFDLMMAAYMEAFSLV